MMVRRGMLLLLSALWMGAVSVGFWTNGPVQSLPAPQSEELSIGTGRLTVLSLAAYEGPFLEGEDREEVVDVAALLLRNEAELLLCHASVTVETGEQILHFEITALPPGATALVLEQGGQPFLQGEIEDYTAAAEFARQRFSPAVSVEEAGPSELLVTNVTEHTLPTVTLRYKTYDLESDTYLGGITYTLTLSDLLPGESRTLTPPYYISAHSRIVSIDT